ncbi:hypothetical protein AB0939_08745 [Streptomyces sp. NPDC006990]|uniref:hypothetical protein n=1 Tax=unclassified Streptomyces TaxID=2593676 RepID=UPI0034523342
MGRRVAQRAISAHGGNIRRHSLDSLTPEQAATVKAWSEQTIDRIEPRHSRTAGDGAT